MRFFNWKLYNSGPIPKKKVSKIKKTFKLGKVASEIILRRGLDNFEDVSRYLNATYHHLHDPYIFRDMLSAVTLIRWARDHKKKIFIHGDYDCDGIVSIAMLKMMCDDIGAISIPYVPNRSMGYGLSKEAVYNAIKSKCDLIIACDCGSNEHTALNIARRNGLSVIVLDHHSYKRKPNVAAFINPNVPEWAYTEPCAAGVVLLFMRALAQYEKNLYPESYIDLAAVATIADSVKLLDDNRIIVKEGLKKLPHTSNLGMYHLLKVSSMLNRKINGEIIGYIIAPKINAAGRISDPKLALDLLLETDPTKADKLAHNLANINKKRQEINNKIRDEAIEVYEEKFKNDRVIVLSNDSWEKGVIGIVASTMVEIYHKPTVIISQGYGSVRTIPEFPLLGPLEACKEYFKRWGGHPMAAGLTVKKRRIKAFRDHINKIAAKQGLSTNPNPVMTYDTKLKVRDLNMNLMEDLEQLEPFGEGNELPHFVIEDINIARNRVTKDNQHLQLSVRQGSSLSSAIGFWMSSFKEVIKDPVQKFDIIFNLERSRINTEQMIIKNLKEVKINW